MSGINATEMLVFLLLFVFVAVMGFMAARCKSGDTMDHLDEWGFGKVKVKGRKRCFLSYSSPPRSPGPRPSGGTDHDQAWSGRFEPPRNLPGQTGP